MLLSIITPSFNRVSVVAEAVDSVLRQDHEPVEHIIVDGGSTDGTLEVLAGYPHLRVVSERDRGIYDAINKGLSLARGDVVGLLNTDDRYEPNVFGAVMQVLESNADADGVAGAARIFEVVNRVERTVRVHDRRSTKILDLTTVTRGVPIINARFFRRAVFERVGSFDLTYDLAADREFLLRAWVEGVRFQPVEAIVYHYRSHAMSHTIGRRIAPSTTDEHLELCRRYLSDPAIPDVLRRELVRWRAQQLGRAVRDRLSTGNLSEAAARSTEGFRLDPAWPLRFAANGIARQIRKRRLEL